MNPYGEPDAPPIRHRFPTSVSVPDVDLRHFTCAQCGLRWVVHKALVSSRVSCSCGEMTEIMAIEADKAAAALPPPKRMRLSDKRAEPSARAVARVGSGGALPVLYDAPDQVDRGMLDHARPEVTAAWNNRLVIELVLILTAFILPSLIVDWSFSGSARTILAPVASVVSAVCILLIGLTIPAFAFGACVKTHARYLLEAVLMAAVFLLMATGWMMLMTAISDDNGPDLVDELLQEYNIFAILFMVAIVPGIFEEIAFRGIVQSRLSALYGIKGGILYTGIAFGLAHFITLALPIHIGLGFYLCWLRARSNSLWPSIIFHILYNSGVVMMTYLMA